MSTFSFNALCYPSDSTEDYKTREFFKFWDCVSNVVVYKEEYYEITLATTKLPYVAYQDDKGCFRNRQVSLDELSKYATVVHNGEKYILTFKNVQCFDFERKLF